MRQQYAKKFEIKLQSLKDAGRQGIPVLHCYYIVTTLMYCMWCNKNETRIYDYIEIKG